MSDSENKVDRACAACGHIGLHVGQLDHGRGVFLRNRTLGIWPWNNCFETRMLVCPSCGHVTRVLTPEALAKLQSKLGDK